MTDKKEPGGIIRNKNRGEARIPGPYQPEYERLGVKPSDAGILRVPRPARPKATFVVSSRSRMAAERSNQEEQRQVQPRGQPVQPSSIGVPKQTHISVGTHTEQMWATLDGEKNWEADAQDIEQVIEKKTDNSIVVDNNDEIDVESLQVGPRPSRPQQRYVVEAADEKDDLSDEEVEEIEIGEEDIQAEIRHNKKDEPQRKPGVRPGEYLLVFRDKTILLGATEEKVCKTIEDIMYSELGETVVPGDFLVFKCVKMHVGVSLKE